MSIQPYIWVYDSPGYFDPATGGEPPYTDFSDEAKPGYTPLYAGPDVDRLTNALAAILDWYNGDPGNIMGWSDEMRIAHDLLNPQPRPLGRLNLNHSP